MCLQWAKHSRFDETRRAQQSRVIFQQSRTLVLGTYLQPRGCASSPSSFAIFQVHLAAFEGLASKSSRFVTLQLCYLLTAFEVLATTRSRFITFELTQNTRINRILYDCTLSSLQINMLTTYMNVNFNEMLETLTFQQSYAQYLYSIHIHKQRQKRGQLQ